MKLRWSNFSDNDMGFHISRIQQGYRDKLHTHSHKDFVELMWINSGKGKHLVNGEEEELCSGKLIFVRQNDRHALQASVRNSLDFTNLAFSSKVLKGMRSRYFQDQDIGHWEKAPLPACHDLSVEQLAQLSNMAEDLSKSENARLNIELFYLSLLKHLFIDKAHNSSPKDTPHWLDQAVDKFQSQANLEAGLESFLDLCGRSQAHVTRSMRKHLNTTPSHFINKVRLSHAAQQLKITNKSILEICYECGFETPSYFYRVFKNTHKLSPKAYRKSQKNPMNLRNYS